MTNRIVEDQDIPFSLRLLPPFKGGLPQIPLRRRAGFALCEESGSGRFGWCSLDLDVQLGQG